MHSSVRGNDCTGHSKEKILLPDVDVKCAMDNSSVLLDISAQSTSQVQKKLPRQCSHHLLSSLQESNAGSKYPIQDNLQCDLKKKSPRTYCSKHHMNTIQSPPTLGLGLKTMQDIQNSNLAPPNASGHKDNHINKRTTLDDSQIAHMFDGSVINPLIDLPEILSKATERSVNSGPRAMRVMPDGTIQNMFSCDVDVGTILDNMESIAMKKQIKTKYSCNSLGQMKSNRTRSLKPSEYMHKLRSISNRGPKMSPYRMLQKVQQKYKPVQDAGTQTLLSDLRPVKQKNCAVQTSKTLLLTRGCQKSLVPIESKHKSTNTSPIHHKKTVSISCQASIEKPLEELVINKKKANKSKSTQKNFDDYQTLNIPSFGALSKECKKLKIKPKSTNIYTQTEISHPYCENIFSDFRDTDMKSNIYTDKKYFDGLNFVCDDDQNHTQDSIAASVYKGQFNLYIIISIIFIIWGILYMFGSFSMNVYIKHFAEHLQEWYFQATENPVTKFELIFAYIWKLVS
ncbi:uncharacterized protein LOC119685492 [Teleopsis dalmanni]|uniref:uncharacterized protein LOC119685492 n=1 Tax=Teleopsis dalmanni TaxID=139649 RepID=UPI0018CF6B0F|nr:uncharacterized protein LOC119685492 [Teleopsis dalmanni]XP_037955710.1 uncharacterized protein LOC119685492 [Teleopsis dalmanni]XP_037955711.1 uncharacterized protein LOC119685492 [Teleopsis dalmanni]